MFISRLLLSSSLIGVLSLPAYAADPPSRVPAATPATALPLFTWTGPYVGGNIGGAKLASSDFNGNDLIGSATSSGTLGGIQVGYDHRAGQFVVGLQATFDLAKSTVDVPSPDPRETFRSEIRSVGTLTTRFGYLIQSRLLIYAKGGLSLADFKYSDLYPNGCCAEGSANKYRSGWTVGTGAEYLITKNWSAFLEYNHIDFGKKTVNLRYSDNTQYGYEYLNRLDSVSLGVNRRF